MSFAILDTIFLDFIKTSLVPIRGNRLRNFCFQELTDDKSRGTLFHDVKSLTKNGQPKELFFSSDLCAIVEHTKNYLAIEDNEVVHIKVKLNLYVLLLYWNVSLINSFVCFIHCLCSSFLADM